MDGYVDLVAVLVLDAQEFAYQPFQRPLDQPGEPPNAIVDMYDPVARMQVRVGRFGSLGSRPRALARLRSFPAEYLGIGDQVIRGPGFGSKPPALGERGLDELRATGCGFRVMFRPEFLEAGGLARDDDDRIALADNLCQIIVKRLEAPAKPFDRPELCGEFLLWFRVPLFLCRRMP